MKKIMAKKTWNYFIVIALVLIISIPALSVEKGHKRINDLFNLDKNMEVTITGVYYHKTDTSPLRWGAEFNIDTTYLKKLFLEKAVTVTGEEINYIFDYERVVVSGIIKNGAKIYTFDYNLAGFGYIHIDKKLIEFADMSKAIPGK